MLFPKGPRFEPKKISDVPGPGTYDLNQESQGDSYKHGAFLEKTDRFSKDKPSDVPGPSAGTTTAKSRPTVPPAKQTNNLAALERKLNDLAQIHAESKRTYQSDIDRLKLELNKAQRTIADQSIQLDKNKKHADASDVRIQEFKKSSLADQSEIKELKLKLRLAEQDKGKQAESRKALDGSELKRREAEKRVVDLEKSLGAEKKKREQAEARLSEFKGTIGEEVIQSRVAQDELHEQVASRQAALNEAANVEKELVDQLNRHRDLLSLAVREYGKLAAQSVPAALEAQLKRELASMQVQSLRMNRKLANSEAQVLQLAHLIRQTKEENKLLSGCLRDAEEEVATYTRSLADPPLVREDTSYDTSVGDNIAVTKLELAGLLTRGSQLTSEFYRLSCQELILLYSIVDKALSHEQVLHTAAATTRESLTTQIQDLHLERASFQQETEKARKAVDEAHKKALSMEKQTAEVLEKLEVEKRTSSRLNMSTQKSKMAEQSLRAEIDQLTLELTDAEQYQEAYVQLSEEVGSLLACNALAEDEAQRLSKFNAEILGHKNPDQRIMYVDRIRRELAETKQKLILSIRDHEAALSSNDELRNELDMYTSVMVPLEHKPKTNMTRVGRVGLQESATLRPPLASQSVNVHKERGGALSVIREKGRGSGVQEVEDMTLEDIS